MLHNFRDSLLTGAYKCFLCCLFVYLSAARTSCIVGFFVNERYVMVVGDGGSGGYKVVQGGSVVSS